MLEIGTGWGGFAVWAASRYGCRVTTTTISEEQYRHACEWVARLGEIGSRITVLLTDYRELQGQFDKVVSIEMFEAVGLNHYDEYFGVVERLLKPNGSMLLQTITVTDQHFPQYHGAPDWIEKHIFPGGELASIGQILRSLARVTSMSVYHSENFGTHYARTLHEWRKRYHQQLDRVRALGFSERFIRMWDLYFAFCEAAFLERHAGVFQLVLNRNGSRAMLFNEPWMRAEAIRPPWRSGRLALERALYVDSELRIVAVSADGERDHGLSVPAEHRVGDLEQHRLESGHRLRELRVHVELASEGERFPAQRVLAVERDHRTRYVEGEGGRDRRPLPA